MRLKLLFQSLFLFLMMAPALLIAQDDKKIDVNVDLDGPDPAWYSQPWVWVVGGAVFLLLLVALLRGGGRRE